MSYYMVGAINIRDKEAYKLYLARATEALAPFDVEYLSLDHEPEVREGDLPAGYMMIVRFASKEEWDRFYHSDLYQSAIQYRHQSSDTKFLVGMKPLTA